MEKQQKSNIWYKMEGLDKKSSPFFYQILDRKKGYQFILTWKRDFCQQKNKKTFFKKHLQTVSILVIIRV